MFNIEAAREGTRVSRVFLQLAEHEVGGGFDWAKPGQCLQALEKVERSSSRQIAALAKLASVAAYRAQKGLGEAIQVPDRQLRA